MILRKIRADQFRRGVLFGHRTCAWRVIEVKDGIVHWEWAGIPIMTNDHIIGFEGGDPSRHGKNRIVDILNNHILEEWCVFR